MGTNATGIGYVFFNPDTGEEYSVNHPIDSGECDDAENVRPSTPFEDHLVSELNKVLLRVAGTEDALETFAADRRLSLDFHQKIYGDDDDAPTHGKWVIWREHGNINDREWDVVAVGASPAEAISALTPEA